MKVVVGYPPNIEAIRAVFPVKGRSDVLFCYGDTVYSPGGEHRVDRLMRAHESVHIGQQLQDGPETWWKWYLEDPEFRLSQELSAHKAEYSAFCDAQPNREKRLQYLHAVAHRLASPLYGNLISSREGRRLILKGRL